MDSQAWYAVLRHRRRNPDTRFAVTYAYCCTLSILPDWPRILLKFQAVELIGKMGQVGAVVEPRHELDLRARNVKKPVSDAVTVWPDQLVLVLDQSGHLQVGRDFDNPVVLDVAHVQVSIDGTLETVFSDPTYQLCGVAVTPNSRIFVSYPYFQDKHKYSVVEVAKDGTVKPFPDETWNSFKKGEDGKNKFVCVLAVYADNEGFLRIVDPAGLV